MATHPERHDRIRFTLCHEPGWQRSDAVPHDDIHPDKPLLPGAFR